MQELLRDLSLTPGTGRSPGGWQWQSTSVFLPGESHVQGNLAGCESIGLQGQDKTEATWCALGQCVNFLWSHLREIRREEGLGVGRERKEKVLCHIVCMWKLHGVCRGRCVCILSYLLGCWVTSQNVFVLCFVLERKFSSLILFAYASKWDFLSCSYKFQRYTLSKAFLKKKGGPRQDEKGDNALDADLGHILWLF